VRVLGVDPGTVVTGWGVLDCDRGRLARVASGTIQLGRGEVSLRLATLYDHLREILIEHEPCVMSLERNFVARNVQSAFRLGEARGVAMAAAAGAGVALSEYSPATIKKSVVGHGRADKAQVQAAICRLLSIAEVPSPDEADALAAGACHAFHKKYDAKVAAALDKAGGAGRRRVRVRAGTR
jgi:crossover junction endodeoxyribonuclease RuvC